VALTPALIVREQALPPVSPGSVQRERGDALPDHLDPIQDPLMRIIAHRGAEEWFKAAPTWRQHHAGTTLLCRGQPLAHRGRPLVRELLALMLAIAEAEPRFDLRYGRMPRTITSSWTGKPLWSHPQRHHLPKVDLVDQHQSISRAASEQRLGLFAGRSQGAIQATL
jgi:hypothetical protein